MLCVNYILLVGNLGSDPEIRVLESGIKMAKFNLATTEVYIDKTGTKQLHTEWHSIVCWRDAADYAQRNLRTGSLVRVEGRIRTRTLCSESPLPKQSPYEIIATSVQLMTNDASQAPQGTNSSPQPDLTRQPSEEQSIAPAPVDVDNLPF